MMKVYKELLPSLGGYLCDGADVDLGRVQTFIKKVGGYEDMIFAKRMKLLHRQRDR